MRSLAAVAFCLSTAACIPLQNLGGLGANIKPPSITFTGATLVISSGGWFNR